MKVKIIPEYTYWNFCDLPLYKLYIIEGGILMGATMIKISEEEGFCFADDKSYKMKGDASVSLVRAVSMTVKRISDDEVI